MLALPHHAIANKPLVAFTARFYYRDKRKSHFQVYVCDIDGKHRRKLTSGSKDCSGVQWVDADHVCFGRDGAIEVVDVRTRRAIFRIAKSNFEGYEQEILSRGKGLFPVYDDGEKSLSVHLQGFEAVKRFEKRQGLPAQTPWGTVTSNKDGDLILNTRRGPAAIQPSDGGFIRDHDSPLRIWTYDHRLWLIYYTGFSSGGYYTLLAWKPSGCKEILTGASVDCDVTKKYFAWADQRWTKPLGKIQVWMANAGVMDWRTGKEAMIATGAVWVSTIALSPVAP